jgi:hypothetical protein
MDKLRPMKRHFVTLILSCIVVCSFVIAVAETSLVGTKAKQFKLVDQFSKEYPWSLYRGKNVILLLADRKGSELTETWTTPLRQKFGTGVEYIPIADVSSVPFFLKSFVRGKIKDKYQYPILLDWDGDVAEHYLLKPDVPTLVFIDKSETVRYYTYGKGTEAEIQKTITEIESILKK